MLKITILSVFLFSGCAMYSTTPTNIIDVTDESWLEDSHGKKCREHQMLITPDTIRYSYPDCGITKIVKTKPHILPKPQK